MKFTILTLPIVLLNILPALASEDIVPPPELEGESLKVEVIDEHFSGIYKFSKIVYRKSSNSYHFNVRLEKDFSAVDLDNLYSFKALAYDSNGAIVEYEPNVVLKFVEIINDAYGPRDFKKGTLVSGIFGFGNTNYVKFSKIDFRPARGAIQKTLSQPEKPTG